MSDFKFINQKDLVLKLFSEGKTYVEIVKIINPEHLDIAKDSQNIRRMIIHFLGDVKNNKKSVIEGHEEQLLEYARNGLKPTEMSRKIGINPVTIQSWFRTKHPEFKFSPNKGNVHYFENIDSYAKAYIVGFIAADGALVKTKTTTSLTITVKYEDKDVLEFIKSEIGNEHNLLEIIRPSSFDKNKMIHHIRYVISDKNITKDLIKLGITYNKSLSMQNIIVNIPYEYRDAFIIGYFDGDGTFLKITTTSRHNHKTKYTGHSLNVSIRGTLQFLEGICDHLSLGKDHIKQYDSIPRLDFASKKDVVRFYNCYNNLPFYYKRKYDKIAEAVNHPSFDKYKQVQTISSSTE